MIDKMLTSLAFDALASGISSPDEALALVHADLDSMTAAAAARRDAFHGRIISYSRKVFIPLTQLCRDVCHYCTFAHPPRKGEGAFLSPDEVLSIARAGQAAGCREALFTLGDKPELRYRVVREELERLGHATTLSYLAAMARLVFEETGLLPHVNPGVLTATDIAALRTVSVSQGLMLETVSERLGERGGPHHGSPDKLPARRLETLELAGELRVPFTTGILIGIGEARRERVEALLAIRDSHARHGHVQEVIVQNFSPKPGTRMASYPAAALDEHRWTIAAARLIFDPSMNVQAPPNLSPEALSRLVEAGINDWGGVSPVTPDHINPEAPWPHLKLLEAETRAAGKELVERLAIYPAFAREPARWADAALVKVVQDRVDADGWPRLDGWHPGSAAPVPIAEADWLKPGRWQAASGTLAPVLDRAAAGRRLGEEEITALFRARGTDFAAVCQAADALRRAVNSDSVSYVVTRNINYTNICYFKCGFCAFSKGKKSEQLRGKPYVLLLDEIAARASEARRLGATEVCMQGGIHPDYTGRTYLDICRAVKRAEPALHVHAFSPLEVSQGAATLGMPVRDFLLALKAEGLATLPGTAAEILDDDVRRTLCPDKIGTAGWLDVMRVAHSVGLRSTATIMFGHVDHYEHWARHLLRMRDLQEETGGFTEFVPLPFVHMEAPIYLKGKARRGPTFREAMLMQAVARLVLHPLITNIQASWVKLGSDGAALALSAGTNDLGGTLMNESISRAAGASHGQEMTPGAMEAIIVAAGRVPRRRTTLYDDAPPEARRPSEAAPVALVV